ncbi:23S rRNA (uracil(1939)-C(5))-methyltransferase RlmD [Carboxydothermus hydrogenoformans]|uniref:23S rRNA (Uracil-5-)-methyltransferase RumA n=1 Tax=Carboxydothermus hydrogenoformans (strain ATCC BAA-161 / DSM 6008 / Z-2901) TaxID=246194 RepID=Q3AD26_CARHZ|nr:23S rRNA (uracil(1939)-C(5))-methyltransferase RlmD [Carboxydothermus hydrogenoformans]ABB15419.1 23S rRNA (uracil-5-)-methyltransferase RumA [Carboxydothermus hydrogenoformans Z-2901]
MEEILEIIDLTEEGLGVGKKEKRVYFVSGDVTVGDVVKVKVTSEKRGVILGEALEILTNSPYRDVPRCPHFGYCGGCSLQNLDYEQQLVLKKTKVYNIMKKIGRIDAPINSVLPNFAFYRYRQKVHFTFGSSQNKLAIGYFDRKNNWFPVTDCLIADKSLVEVAHYVTEILDAFKLKAYFNDAGVLRHLVVRKSSTTGEIQVVITAVKLNFNVKEIAAKILLNPEIQSLTFHENPKKTREVFGKGTAVTFGTRYITEELLGISYRLTPLSFFQINPVQAEKIYRIALDYLDLGKTDMVFDGYSGVGSLTLPAARIAASVVGVEEIRDAVEVAKTNAKLNGIANVNFFAGKVEEKLPWLLKKGYRFNKIILDPPREGVKKEVLEEIIKLNPERIVYVSCNPATQARDLKILAETGYYPVEITPVDMFSQTMHVENVVLLKKK